MKAMIVVLDVLEPYSYSPYVLRYRAAGKCKKFVKIQKS